jgi:hypothetical protein
MDFAAHRDERERQAQRLASSADDATAASVLGRCAGLVTEKAKVADRIVARGAASTDLLPLVRHLDDGRLARIAEDSIAKPERAELMLEIARHAPHIARLHVKRIHDENVLAATRAGAPSDWIPPLLDAYQTTRDTKYIRAIGQIRTDEALECLIDTSKSAPSDHIPAFALAIENAGVSPQSRHPSIYFDAFRAYVVSREESPHHMGPGYPHAVPLCVFCQNPAERVVTLDARHLPDYELEVNPTFFAYRCACDNSEYIVVKHVDDGLEGVAATMITDGPVRSALQPSSLLLEAFPSASVVGGPARPGAGEHQVGGYPSWIHERFFPRVPGTNRGMMFVGSIDIAQTPLGWETGQKGIMYCFFDDESRIAVSLRQTP